MNKGGDIKNNIDNTENPVQVSKKVLIQILHLNQMQSASEK